MITRKQVAGITMALLLATAITLVPAASLPPLPETETTRLQEAFHLVATRGPAVWPGFDGTGSPVLLIVGETEYLLNHDEPHADFQTIPDESFRDHPVFARPATFPPGLEATFPAIGTSTIVVGTAEATGRSPASWVLMVAHEMFHVFQASRGLNDKINALEIGTPEDSNWHLNYPFPYDDEEVQNGMHLLGYSLFRMTQLPEGKDTAAELYEARTANEALRNLEVLLDLRYKEPRHVKYMRYQTTKEGVARYVEYNLARFAISNSYEPLQAYVQAEGNDSYREAWDARYENLLFQIKHAGRVSRNRVEFYGLGMGLALALDRVKENWKEIYFEPGIWLVDLMDSAVQGNGS